MSPIQRLARHTPITRLSRHHRYLHLKAQLQQSPSYFPTPFEAHAHPLQTLTAIHHIGFLEAFILLLSLTILIALVGWIIWIICIEVYQKIQVSIKSYDVRTKIAERRERREEQVQKAETKVENIAKKIGNAGRQLFEGLTRSGGWRERELGDQAGSSSGERRGLLSRLEGGEVRSYGYHEGTIYRDMDGDGTSESTGSGKFIKHREDCDGQCGVPRRRSVEV